MAWDKGFNFRGTSGFKTDGTDETYVLADTYPVTRNGVTFGWEQAASAVDRDVASDRRLAGVNYFGNNGTGVNFRVDLPATGRYSLRCALGDRDAQTNNSGIFKDDTTTFLTLLFSNAAYRHMDAAAVDYADADWVTSNSAITRVFSSSIMRLLIGSPATGFSTISHIFLSQLSGAQFNNRGTRPRPFAPGIAR